MIELNIFFLFFFNSQKSDYKFIDDIKTSFFVNYS